ncbi:imidazole glycerol phosphate synthase subunit HisH [Flavobacteriaceae bacterium]|nr:imidazole glycerol phosphate synthase subunit HisH [Flavobacteriaceae bacterium]MDB3862336.1 imidazole glycerol phosphate synthase subunit HisH [Flavobacteriaceae bacterium]MDC3354336.1 imidazole glycerol phosphate synthase subunit HisH [Flavobacteriaceae bacterium]
MIAIVDYGAGNTKSLQFALKRLGVESILTANAEEISAADKVIFPGQGAAASAMKKLKQQGLHTVIPTLTQPVLGICLGMQLLCAHTEEGSVDGLGMVQTVVKRFTNEVKVPQMGWNRIHNLKGSLFEGIEEGSYMYLVHSYFVPELEETVATSNYNGVYSVALQKDNFYGVQFHPEKSSRKGQLLLANFLNL